MKARVCIVTSGHLSTSPRMLKAADGLSAAGYRVRVVSARHTGWASAADREARRRRRHAWRWTVVDHGPATAPWRYLWTGVRLRAARRAARLLRSCPWPGWLVQAASSRAYRELLRGALAEPAELYYGGTTRAIAAVVAAARRLAVPYALDLEDFHTAEQDADTPASRLDRALIERLEHDVLPGAAFLTTASAAIAAAYTEQYGVRPVPIHNVFPLPSEPPEFTPSPGEGLRLYWFSQTIGPGRGLEDAVRAMGVAGIAGELPLRGRPVPDYLRILGRLAEELAPRLKIVHHEPAPPDEMVGLCAGYDAGLAVEPGCSLNNRLAASNKLFTYL